MQGGVSRIRREPPRRFTGVAEATWHGVCVWRGPIEPLFWRSLHHEETLAEGDEVVCGIIYEFGHDETFYAWKDGGAWLDGKSIRVSQTGTVSQSLIATGFPYTDFRYLDNFMESIRFFMKHSRGLRRLGSAAVDIAYVACGRYDAFYEYGLNPWDIAAGILLVKEAGGSSSDFEGHPDPLYREDIICSNGRIQDEFQKVTRQIMRDQ